MGYSFAILFTCGLVGMIIGFVIGLICNGDVKKLNETINDLDAEVDYWKGSSEQFKQINFEALEQNSNLISEVNRLSDLVATLQAKVPARNARGKFVAR